MLERLLIVGLGSIGRRHAYIARELLPRARILALRHSAKSLPADVPIDGVVDTIDQALAFRPQAAVIASPSTFHLDTALQLARQDTHLLVEKPLAAELSGVSELIETCKRTRHVLMTGYNLRFMPSLMKLRELVRSGAIGRPLLASAAVGQYLPEWRPGSDYRKTVSARAALGGGVLLELSHEVDYLLWVLGKAQRVYASLSRSGELEVDVEDCALLTLSMEFDGSPVQVSLQMDFVRRDPIRECTIAGSHGTLRWDGLRGTVFAYTSTKGWQSVHRDTKKMDSYRAEWRHFLACIKQRSAPLIGGHEGYAVLQVLHAARESARQGCFVEVANEAELGLGGG